MTKPLHQLLDPGVRHPMLAWCTAMLCLAAGVAFGWQAVQHERVAASVQDRLGRAQAARQLAVPAKPSKAELDIRRRWDALAAERAFNWYPVFRALEQTANADIELLEFEPDKAGGRIVLRGEARSDSALTRYLAALAAQGEFDEVHLAHQKNTQRSGLTVVVFEVRAVIRVRKSL